MIPVMQTLFGAGEGNCLPACLASILELDIEDVPNFCSGPTRSAWFSHMAEWLSEDGLCPVLVPFAEKDPGPAPSPEHLAIVREWLRERRIGLAIVNGYTKRGLCHSTVWLDGELEHDPHPDRSPLLNVVSVIVLAQRDPRE